MSILPFRHWFFISLTLHHWFLIGLTLHPLAWYSSVHCIGTSDWLLLRIGNSHWILDIGSNWIGTIITGITVVPKHRSFHIGWDIRWLV